MPIPYQVITYNDYSKNHLDLHWYNALSLSKASLSTILTIAVWVTSSVNTTFKKGTEQMNFKSK